MKNIMADILKPVHQVVAGFLICVFISCSDNNEIPFPEEQLTLPQPVSQKLVFTESRPLKWDTIKKGGIQIVKKTLDIDALPSIPYDTSGFKPFLKPPVIVPINFKNLPEKTFDFDKIPSVPLEFKTSINPIPSTVKIISPGDPKGRALSILSFNQANGLPAKEITGLLKTKHGTLWICSPQGVFRFNGNVLETFIQGNNNEFISGITEDNSGRLWFKSDFQIGMLDPNTNTVSYSPKIKSFSLSKIAKTKEGLLCLTNWVDSSVCMIDPDNFTFKSIGFKNGLNSKILFQVYPDNDDNLWVTTESSGINIIDYRHGKIKYLNSINGLSSDSLFILTVDKKGQVLIPSRQEGLNVIDTRKGTIKRYNQQQNISPAFPLSIDTDSEGQIWLGTFLGIHVINTEKQATRSIKQDDGLSGNIIISLLPEYNRVWVGSTLGLNIVAQNAITAYPFQANQLISILTEKDGTIWTATNDGIRIIQPSKHKISILKKEHGLADNIVQSFVKLNDKICVTSDGGFDIIDPVNKTLEHTGKAEGLVNDTIYAAFFDKAGKTYITGPASGINLIDARKKIILHASVKTGLSDEQIQDIREDNHDNIWLATNKKGVDVFDIRTSTIKTLNNQPGLSDTCNRILLKDKEGRIWIGTDKGIYVADIKQSTLTPISTREGLPENKILSLLEYNGAVIAGTANNLQLLWHLPAFRKTGQEAIKANGRSHWQHLPPGWQGHKQLHGALTALLRMDLFYGVTRE
jgi:ligand-binding sensor domain-containing protein